MHRTETVLIALLASALLVTPSVARAGDEPPRQRRSVLVVMPVQPGRPAYDRMLSSLLETISQDLDPPPEVFVENLGEQDAPDAAARAVQREWLRSRYSRRHVDLVVAIGDSSTDARDELGLESTTPLVFAAWGPRPLDVRRPPDATGVVARESVDAFVGLVRTLLPGARSLAFVGGASPGDHAVNDPVLARLRSLPDGPALVDLTGLSLAELKSRAEALPPGTVIVLGITLLDREGRPLSHPLVLSTIRPVTAAPIFAPIDTAVGHGILGGLLFRPEDIGRATGRQVLRVLGGDPPNLVNVVEIQSTPTVDWTEMRRLGIPETRVPAGAVVINRAPTTLQRHRLAIVGTAAVVLLQAALIAWLGVEQRRRRGVEAQLSERRRFEAMIHEVSERLANIPAERLDEQLPDVLRTLGQAIDVDRCTLRRFDPERQVYWMVARWNAGGMLPPAADADVPVDPSAPGHESISKGEPYVVPDAQTLAGRNATTEAFERAEVRGAVVLPIRIQDRNLGLIALGCREPRSWSPHELTALRPVTEIVGTALVRQQQEREARQHRETLSHLDRVAALGELATSLAHELNQPLGAILANAEAARLLLTARPPRIGDAMEALADIVSDDERAGGIIRNMRAMIRRRSTSIETVDVRTVVGNAVRLVQQDAVLRQCRVDVRHQEPVPVVSCDPIQLQQVVVNLLGNALEASSEGDGSVVEVATGASAGDVVTIAVRDHGPGLPPGVIDRVFEPFFTTKATGLGVGLAISRSIIETYGGWISAENAPGGGARFALHLPVLPRVET